MLAGDATGNLPGWPTPPLAGSHGRNPGKRGPREACPGPSPGWGRSRVVLFLARRLPRPCARVDAVVGAGVGAASAA